MTIKSLSFSGLAAILLLAGFGFSQTFNTPSAKKAVSENTSTQRSTPAYAEVLLRRTEIQSEVESLVVEYTEEYPKVVEMRYSLGILKKEEVRILTVKVSESSKLTLALGKLMVKKAELETDLWKLLKSYKEEHPDVKRAKKKVEIYEAAIKEILG